MGILKNQNEGWAGAYYSLKIDVFVVFESITMLVLTLSGLGGMQFFITPICSVTPWSQ